MKAAKKILSLMLAACMAFVLLPQSALADSPPVCKIGETPYYNFADALTAAINGAAPGAETTITLLDDIEYDEGIVVEDKTVIFDLNGFNLEVENGTGHGLEVGAGGVVTFTGYDEAKDNEFYVIGSGFFGGVYAHDGGKATVSYAEGFVGAFAQSGGEITVLGGAWGASGVYATGSGSKVTVNGDVEAEGFSEGEAGGVAVENGGQVIINGDLAISGASVLGVKASDDPTGSTSSTVHINGMFTVNGDEKLIGKYIEWDEGLNEEGPELEGEYLHYTDGHSHVYTVVACMIDTTAYVTFDDAIDVVLAAPAGSSTTVKLLKDIDYYESLIIAGKTLTFDLNGHELSIMSSGGPGLEVGAGGVVDITGDTGKGYSALATESLVGYGVYAHNGGQATVTQAGGQLGGAWADGTSEIYVKDMVSGVGPCVTATNGGTVTVDGPIIPNGYGVYIMLGTAAKVKADGVLGEAPYENYLVYSDGSNTVRAKTEAVCKLSLTMGGETYVTLHETLKDALDTVNSAPNGSTATITLFADIEYLYGIEVISKAITFNLNGHTLNVTSNEGDGLYVNGSNSVVDIVGTGEFNVKSTDSYRCGVLAVNGGQATVTNATSTSGTGAGTDGEDNSVEVMGNVTGADGIGVSKGSKVIVHGNIIATGANGDGVFASGGGLAVIDGTITVPDGGVYIMLGDDFLPLNPDNGVPMTTGDYAGYLRYTEGTNYVYVKQGPALNPVTASFDKNTSKQADVTTTVTWNNAGSITAVKAGATPLVSPADYSVSGNTLTVKKAYLAAKAVGSLVLTVVFDNGASAVLTIAVSDSASGVVTPGGDSPAYGARTLTDAATGVTVSGGMQAGARLTVAPVEAKSLPDAIKKAAAKGALLLGFEVTLSGAYQGSLTISFPVGAQYNGQTVTVLHYVNGKAEAHTAVVADGKATVTVTGLSPFAVVLPAQAVKVPNTGEAAAAYGFALILLAALLAGCAVRKKHRA